MMLELIAIKAVLITVALHVLSLAFGGWVKFRGLAPLLTTAAFIVPINVFIPDLTILVGLPLRPLYILAAAAVCNSVVLYILSLSINQFRIENFPAAIAFALLLSAFSFYVNISLAKRIAELI